MDPLRIAPGVTLTAIPTDRFQTNYLAMNFLLPLSPETAAQNALVPRVLRRGCRAWPTLAALTERLQNLYNASLGGMTPGRIGEVQLLRQELWALDDSVVPGGEDLLGGTLSLLRELWFSPLLADGVFRADYTESEKRSLTDAIRAKINNKNAYAALRCRQILCEGEAYGAGELGDEAGVAAASPADVYAAYRNIVQRAPCEIFYVGRGDVGRVADALTEAFASVPRTRTPIPPTAVVRRADAVRRVTEEEPVRQGKLSLGFRLGAAEADGERAALRMFNEIFGGSPVSKLFMNVREKMSLCYYCSSSMDALKGVLFVHSGIENETRETAEEAILTQLDEIRAGHITDEELEAARRSLISSLRQMDDAPNPRPSWLLARRVAGRPVTVKEEAAQIAAVRREDVARLAQNVTLGAVYFLRGTLADAAAGEDGEEENA